jgi:photosystem II stability/assembly factor-like uncharacterized protein
MGVGSGRRRLHPLALILCAALLDGCFSYRWEARGPFEMSGAIRHLLVDPVDAHRLYAAAENGGLWVLDDERHPENGWRPLSDNLENLQMRGIAVSSVDAQYLVTANSLGFVYHSRDGGKTWTRITDQNFQYIRRILMAEGLTRVPAGNYTKLAKETRLWVASRLGLFRIRLVNDAFDHVDQLFPKEPGQGSDVLDAARNPANGALFVGVRDHGVWRSLDDGLTWTLSADPAVFGDPLSPMIKIAMNSSRIVAKFGRNVIINDQAGDPAAWHAADPIAFVIPPNNQPERGGSDIGYRGNYSGQVGEWTHAVAIDPADNDVIAAGQAALFLTQDGGQNWIPITGTHEDIQSLAFSPHGESLFIATDGGVFKLSLPSHQASSLNVQLATAQFFRVGLNGPVAVGDADHQGIWGSRNIEASPVHWERATRRDSGFGNDGLENDFVSSDPTAANRFLVAFDSQTPVHLLRLRFPGVGTSEDLLTLNPPANPLRPFSRRLEPRAAVNQLNYPVGTVAFDPRPGSHIMLVSVHIDPDHTFGIDMTSDAEADPSGGPRESCPNPPPPPPVGGCFEHPVAGTAVFTTTFGPVPTPIVSISFSPSEPGKAYALDESGAVFVRVNIDDAAENWHQVGGFAVAAGDFARQIIVDRSAPGRLFAISHRRVQASNDGGATWHQRGQSTLPAAQFNSLCLHPTRPNILYLATSSDVLVSNDSGATWSSIGAGLPNAPVMQIFTNSTHVFAVTFGRGLWRAKLPG